MAEETDWIKLCLAGGQMSKDDAAKLEARLAESPDDLRTRIELLGYYFRLQTTDEKERRNEHVLWLIANHPEISVGAFNHVARPLSPEAYAKATQLWQTAIEQQPNNTMILRRASDFFTVWDKALAAKLMRRGATLEPSAAYWHERLAWLRTLAAQNAEPQVRADLCREALAEYESALAFEQLPDRNYSLLIELAEAAFEAKHYSRAKECAERVLVDAKSFDEPLYSMGLHYGHVILGRLALVENDVASAREHLAAARAVPGLSAFIPDQELAGELLARTFIRRS